MDKNWKQANMKLISSIYLHTEINSNEDWIMMNEECQNEGVNEVKHE